MINRMCRTLSFFVLIVLFLLQSCGWVEKKKNIDPNVSKVEIIKEDTVINYLKEFYIAYMTECCKPQEDILALDSIKSKYLTKELLAKWNSEEIYADPILNAQDCAEEAIETISVIGLDNSIYKVCYFFDETEICLKLYVVNRSGICLIDDIQYQ